MARRFGRVRYVTVAVKNGDLMRLLKCRFDILDKIRWEAKGQEEEDLARDPTAVMVRTPDKWHASRWKVRASAWRRRVGRDGQTLLEGSICWGCLIGACSRASIDDVTLMVSDIWSFPRQRFPF